MSKVSSFFCRKPTDGCLVKVSRQLTIFHPEKCVGKLRYDLQPVFYTEDGHAFITEIPQDLRELCNAVLIQIGKGLVKQQDSMPATETGADEKTLFLTA